MAVQIYNEYHPDLITIYVVPMYVTASSLPIPSGVISITAYNQGINFGYLLQPSYE